ncbi:unnamed protein product [Orchesella dallaii]|uniref:C2H2-type domain-containing protein n=1 Tax=Orchesella dallaii TaxID=48710 RepID=A0ABP1PID0_9HEXA
MMDMAMDVSNVCFVCLKTIKGDSRCRGQRRRGKGESLNILSSSVFPKFVKEYLGLVEEEVGVELASVFKNIRNFCEKCEVVIGSLCELYLEHLGYQLRLAWKLGELRKLLANQVDSAVGNVNHLRNLLLGKCIQKGKTNDNDSVRDHIKKEVKKESLSSGEECDDDTDDGEEMQVDELDTKAKLEQDDFDSDCPSPGGFSESSWEEDQKSNHKGKPVRKRKRTATPKSKCSNSKAGGAKKRRRVKKEKPSLELEGWSCSICKEPTTHEANLRTHIDCHQKKVIQRNFQCTFCWKSYENRVNFDTHVVIKHMNVAGNGAYSCEASECPLAFPTLEELNSHSETHLKNERSLSLCKTCGLGCLDQNRLKLHKLQHIQPIKLSSTRKDTPKRRCSKLLYPCSNCDEIFPKYLHLHDHFCQRHCSALSNMLYKCPKCGILARTKQLHRCLSKYWKGKTKRPNLVCSDCHDQKEFKNRYGLQAHRRDFHIPVECSRCSITVFGLLQKKEHENNCILLHSCPTCGKGFPTALCLSSHIRYVHIEETLKCSQCDMEFKGKFRLQRHVEASHSGVRSHVCEHCGKSYTTRAYLQKHLNIKHQVEVNSIKRHQCPSCKESFGRKEAMESHVLKCDPVAAAKVMPTCNICGRPIMYGSMKTAMEKHVITHMSVEEREEFWKEKGKEKIKLLCHICGKEFTSKRMLERHAVVHLGEQSFLCGKCPKAFDGKLNLSIHMKQVHCKK